LSKTHSPLAHRLYRRIRPFMTDVGVTRLARRVLPASLRNKLAARMGLSGFDPASAPGRIPRWLTINSPTARNTEPLRGINYVGDLRADIGISEHGRLMVRALHHAGLNVALTESAYNFPGRTQPLPHFLETGSPYPVTILDQNFPQLRDALNVIPREALFGHYRIGLWAWELDRFPNTVNSLFPFLNEIWVASRFTQDALALAAPIPVVRMPFPVTARISATASRAPFHLPDDRFIFLFAFSGSSSAARKNPFAVIDAFERAFGSTSPNVQLVIKAHHLDLPDSATLAPRLRERLASVGGRLIEANFDRQTMYDLIGVCDCFVSLHRAEGFGLAIAEAMALGKPVIATAYSGNLDFMRPSNSFGVRYSVRPIHERDHADQPQLLHLYPPDSGMWAEPDIDHAAALMHTVAADPDLARAVGAQAAHDMHAEFSLEAVARRVRIRTNLNYIPPGEI